MKTYLPAALAGTALTTAAILFGAATAHVAPSPQLCLYESASQAAGDLQSQGYDVQFNGPSEGDLSTCAVTRVDGYTTTPSGTVYLTVDCHGSTTSTAA